MNTEIIFSDLDGTLLNDVRQISDLTVSTLSDVVKNNDLFFSIASGRPPQFVGEIAARFNLGERARYHACYNGGVIFDALEKRVVSEQVFDLEVAHEIISFLIGMSERIVVFTDDKIFTNQGLEFLQATYGNQAAQLDFDSFNPNKIYKILTGGFDQKSLPVRFLNLAEFSLYNPREDKISAEISPLGVNKGSGLQRICEILHIPLENTLAFGDSTNDHEMLKLAGKGVSLANGTAVAKHAADEVYHLSSDQDGVASYLKHHF